MKRGSLEQLVKKLSLADVELLAVLVSRRLAGNGSLALSGLAGEMLLTQKDICERLRIGRSTFARILPGLMADGLQRIKLFGRGPQPFDRYRAASLDRVIQRASRYGNILGEACQATETATGTPSEKAED